MDIRCPRQNTEDFKIIRLLEYTTKEKFVRIIDELTMDPIDVLDQSLGIESMTPENDWWKKTLRYYKETRVNGYGEASGPNVINSGGFKVIYDVGDYAASVELTNNSMANKRRVTFDTLKKKFVNKKCLLALPEDVKIIQADDNVDRCLIITKWEKCVMDGFALFKELLEHKQTSTHKHMMNNLHYDLGRALKLLHDKGVYILDLKPENMLVCNNKLKYADLDDVIIKEDIRKAVYQRIRFKYNLKYADEDDSLSCVRELVTPEFSWLIYSNLFKCFKSDIELVSMSDINKAVELYCSLYAYVDWYAWSMIVCLNEPRYLNIFLSEQWDQQSKIPPVLRKPIIDNSDYNPNLDVLTNIRLYKQNKYNEMKKASISWHFY